MTAAGGGHVPPLDLHVVLEAAVTGEASASAATPSGPHRDEAFAPGPLALAVPAPSRGALLGPRSRTAGPGPGGAQGGDEWTGALSIRQTFPSNLRSPSFRTRSSDPGISPRPPPLRPGTSWILTIRRPLLDQRSTGVLLRADSDSSSSCARRGTLPTRGRNVSCRSKVGGKCLRCAARSRSSSAAPERPRRPRDHRLQQRLQQHPRASTVLALARRFALTG